MVIGARDDRTTAGLLDRMDQAVGADDIPKAVDLARQILSRGAETPLALNLAAFGLEMEGRPEEALPLLDRALGLAPQDPLVFNAIGRVYGKLGQGLAALAAYDTAIRLAPGYSAAYTGRGLALEVLGRDDEAWASHETALKLDAKNPDAMGALAALAVRQDRDDARQLAERALQLDPSSSSATLSLALLDRRAGDMAAVEARLAPLLARGGLTPLHEASARRTRGDGFHAEGRWDEALGEYHLANALIRRTYSSTYRQPTSEDGIALCRRLKQHFSAMEAWSPAPRGVDSPAHGHVFLVGFPRSGTTLLEQVLASHPQVHALEERATLGDVGAWFEDAAALERLAALTREEADALRSDYWTRVRAFGGKPDGRVFVDKSPFNTLWLPYMAKLFPQARILFARRDPRDVVLSCYRNRFTISAATFHFTDLTELARFYSGTMSLAEVYREKLALAWRVHRHEDLVEDFDTEAKGVCEFLGLPWTDAMRDFAETAKRRDVRTPSAPQVRRGLYREGMAQWRNYAEGMAEALPILQPWVDRYGYPAA